MFKGLSTEQTNRLVWAPDFFGSIAFLVASHLAWLLAATPQARASLGQMAEQDYLSPEGLVALGAMLGLDVALDS